MMTMMMIDYDDDDDNKNNIKDDVNMKKIIKI